jgi:hypothetical protein
LKYRLSDVDTNETSDPNSPITLPEGRVEEIEKRYMKDTLSATGALAKLSINGEMPARPGYGTQGRKIVVYANYFKLNTRNDLTLTRYSVVIAPEAKGKKLERVFQLLLEQPEFSGVATEWRTMIISSRPLDIPADYSIQIPYRSEGETESLPRAVTYTVRIIRPLSFSVSDLVNFLSSTAPGARFEHKAEVIQVLNAVLGHHPHAQPNLITVGQNKYFSKDRSERNRRNIAHLGVGLESLRGYFQSVRPATGGLLLNVNVIHGVFIQPDRLDRLFPLLLRTEKIDTLEKKMKMVRVKVLHLPGKLLKTGQEIPRIKTIFGLARRGDGRGEAKPPQVSKLGAGPNGVKFWLSEVPPTAGASAPKAGKPKKPSASTIPSGQYITVFDFFKKKYGTDLDDRLPVVNVGNGDHPMYLPAEVCEILPGQTIKRKLSPDETANMILFACRKPYENANSIIGDGKAVLGHANPQLAQWGIQVGSSLLTVSARVMHPPIVKYKDGRSDKEKKIIPKFGSWNLADTKFFIGSNLGLWTYIIFTTDRPRSFVDLDGLRAAVDEFGPFMTRAGINATGFVSGSVIELYDREEGRNNDAIKRIFRQMFDSGNRKPKFVLCIIPYADVAIYNSIKNIADTKAGIHTVCCIASKLVKRQPQYYGNVSMKFNLKAGGINQQLDPAKLGIISEGETMVMGIDVTHPQPGSAETAPSVAGVVASIDKFLGQWPADFDVQERRKEMVTALERMVMGRLSLWYQHNKNWPKNLLIYRDGVSEGQYSQVLNQELPLIRNACRQKYPATMTKEGLPKITVVICGKRHHTRFYPTKVENADRSSNCEPGTVVDRGVTEAGVWEFFIQPHACLQGTARPCHYVVILDEIFRARKLKPPHQNAADALEELTHNMCHLFGRATKAVSLCPPAYYADLLCERMRCYLAGEYNPSDNSDTASTSSGQTPVREDIRIPDNMKDSMFYI